MDRIGLDRGVLAELRLNILSCLLLKVLNSLPASFHFPFSVLGGPSSDTMVEKRCRQILASQAVWDALPEVVLVSDADFARIRKDLGHLGVLVEGIGAYSFYTKDALREDMKRFLNHFSWAVKIIEDEPRANALGNDGTRMI